VLRLSRFPILFKNIVSRVSGNAVLHIPMRENDVILIEVDPGN